MELHQLQPIKGVIFDLDGTLLSSSINFAGLCQRLNVAKGTDLLEHIKYLPESQKATAIEMVQAEELADADTAEWLPGAKRFWEALQQLGLPVAIITRNFRLAAERKLALNHIQAETLICREDAPPKPNPQALLQVSEQWQLKSTEVMYVGDYIYDLQAANNANMLACLYTGSHVSDDTYRHFLSLADLCIDHFDTLSEQWLRK